MARKGNPIPVRLDLKNPSNWRDKIIEFLERHILFLKITISLILIYVGFFLYTLDRSFRVHQDTLSRILHWNNREGLFCSRVHVGHDGTTLEFQTVPQEVGTAGTIDSSSLSGSPVDPFEIVSLIPKINSALVMLISLSLFLLLLFFVTKKWKKRETSLKQQE